MYYLTDRALICLRDNMSLDVRPLVAGQFFTLGEHVAAFITFEVCSRLSVNKRSLV